MLGGGQQRAGLPGLPGPQARLRGPQLSLGGQVWAAEPLPDFGQRRPLWIVAEFGGDLRSVRLVQRGVGRQLPPDRR